MPDLLLELFSEEIPARMQEAAARELERLVVGAISDRGLLFDGVRSFSGPRRLVLAMTGLPARQPDTSEERKGPRVDAPQKAIEGFLRSAGVPLEECVRQSDSRGEFYVAVLRRSGQATEDVLRDCLPKAVADLSWPKSMRWPGSEVRWVRPLHRIVCTFDGEVVPFTFAGIESGRTTQGHRFLSRGEIEVRRFDDYETKLRDAFVIVGAEERKQIIAHEMEQTAFALGLEPIEDPALLDEVAGLAEWPKVMLGTIDAEFMDLPTEILRSSMRLHQKYFALRELQSGKAANRFAVVANMPARNSGAEIVTGNERVLRARLSDAKFFWDQDRKRRLESRVAELKTIVFHARAGTLADRADRIALLALALADVSGADPAQACRAGMLAKADLVSGVVGEFPDLQGIMGRLYALHDGEAPAVADAIRDHYRPLGPNDRVPDQPVSIAVALAEKLDTLVTLWRAGEKPTGSKDPFALRRAGIGAIRLVLDNRLRLPLKPALAGVIVAASQAQRPWPDRIKDSLFERSLLEGLARHFSAASKECAASAEHRTLLDELLAFLADRLKVVLRDKGVRHDLIDAVFSLGGEDDFVRLVARVEALQSFLESVDGANLLAGYRRAVNIVRIEEKKDGTRYDVEPDPALLAAPEEIALFGAMAEAREIVAGEISRERFTEAMTAMARLRGPVDAFFDKVTVNVADMPLRQNRLLLLSRLRASLHAVADFSRIEG